MQNLGGKQSVLWAIGKQRMEDRGDTDTRKPENRKESKFFLEA